MIIIGIFQHSIELEQAIAKLEKTGIARVQLLVVCMDSESKDDTSKKQQAERSNSRGVEIGIACATALSVIGTSFGFILPWGPIICGLIASLMGFCLGYGIYAVIRRPIRRHQKEKPEVTVIVQCKPEQSEHVQNVMWMNHALTVGIAHASTE